MELLKDLQAIESEFSEKISGASSLEDMEALRIEFLGRKGRVAKIMAQIPSLPENERPACGQLANNIKTSCSNLFNKRKSELENSAETSGSAFFDPTMPGVEYPDGSLHPITLTTGEICRIFEKLGFEIASGPEVELDWYNFEALNLPPEHPARDMQDTFYISGQTLLRTHTSPVQIRSMLATKPPLAVIAPGKVYRRDSDLTHSPMFHQVEGLAVGENMRMADLKGVLLAFAKAIFGSGARIRFRPSFFPFTEPSAEADVSCFLCNGSGRHGEEPCRVCKGSGWIEILGCGMIDPAVFKAVGYSTELTGFAFGLGVERVAMLKYGISDLRLFFQNDLRFLRQFGRLA